MSKNKKKKATWLAHGRRANNYQSQGLTLDLNAANVLRNDMFQCWGLTSQDSVCSFSLLWSLFWALYILSKTPHTFLYTHTCTRQTLNRTLKSHSALLSHKGKLHKTGKDPESWHLHEVLTHLRVSSTLFLNELINGWRRQHLSRCKEWREQKHTLPNGTAPSYHHSTCQAFWVSYKGTDFVLDSFSAWQACSSHGTNDIWIRNWMVVTSEDTAGPSILPPC